MKQYLKKTQFIYCISGGLLSLFPASVLHFYRDNSFLGILAFSYCFSFFIAIIVEHKDWLRKRDKEKFFRSSLKSDRVFYALWLTMPNAVFYCFMLKNHPVAMYLVWFLFAILTIWLLKSPWYSKEQETAQNEQGEKTS